MSTEDGPVDLVINTLSLSEMSHAQINDYCESISQIIGGTGDQRYIPTSLDPAKGAKYTVLSVYASALVLGEVEPLIISKPIVDRGFYSVDDCVIAGATAIIS